MKCKSYLFIHFILILGFSMMFATSTQFRIINFPLDNPLSINAGEISIRTPENITYAQSMTGYYPSSYGFESEEDGKTGLDINFITRFDSDSSLAYAEIEANVNGHNKVIKFYDADLGGNKNFYAYHDFETKIPYGTIEFWALNKEYSGDQSGIYYHFANESGATYTSIDTFNSLFVLMIDVNNDNLVRLETGNGMMSWSDLYSEDIWYHIRIDFESSLGGYLGLEQYHLNFWFNGVQKLSNEPLRINDSLGIIASHSHGWDNTRHDYLDAFGFSWEPNYSIGDNRDEGLLVSYENSTNLDWKGYSLDGQENRTILGNTTISLPNNGLHSIQVFGNDSLGTIYESEVRYFTIGSKSPASPINPAFIIVIVLSTLGIAVAVSSIYFIYTKRKGVVREITKKEKEIQKTIGKPEVSKETRPLLSFCPFCGVKLLTVRNYCTNCGENIKKMKKL